MKANDKDRFSLAIDFLASTYGKEFERDRKRSYFMALEDLPIEGIESAIQAIVKKETRCPVPATIREYYDQIRRATMVDYQPRRLSLRPEDQPTDWGKRCAKNMQRLFDGELTLNEFIIEGVKLCDEKGYDASGLEQLWQNAA